MHSIEVFGTYKDPKRARIYTFPGSFQECTPEQIALVTTITSATRTGDADKAEMRVRIQLLHVLTGIPDEYFVRLQHDCLMDVRYDEFNVDRAAFLPSLDWAFEKPLWDTSLVPQVTVGKQVYQGPADRLARFRIKQWIFCESLLEAFQSAPSEDGLNTFLAALYHPKGKKWNSTQIGARAAQLAALDDHTKLAAVVNWQALRAWIETKHPPCFRGGTPDPHGPLGMVVRLAGPKFGTTAQVHDANIHEVFTYVDQCIKEAEELERRTQ